MGVNNSAWSTSLFSIIPSPTGAGSSVLTVSGVAASSVIKSWLIWLLSALIGGCLVSVITLYSVAKSGSVVSVETVFFCMDISTGAGSGFWMGFSTGTGTGTGTDTGTWIGTSTGYLSIWLLMHVLAVTCVPCGNLCSTRQQLWLTCCCLEHQCAASLPRVLNQTGTIQIVGKK